MYLDLVCVFILKLGLRVLELGVRVLRLSVRVLSLNARVFRLDIRVRPGGVQVLRDPTTCLNPVSSCHHNSSYYSYMVTEHFRRPIESDSRHTIELVTLHAISDAMVATTKDDQ